MTSAGEPSYVAAWMEAQTALAEYRPRYDEFVASLGVLSAPRHARPSGAFLAKIGELVELLANSLTQIVATHERIPELRRDNRLEELQKAHDEIKARAAELLTTANRRRQLLRSCGPLIGYWTPARHEALLRAIADAKESAAVIALAIQAFDPTIEPVDETSEPIEDKIHRLTHSVPEEEWQRLPADFNANLDSYLYGR